MEFSLADYFDGTRQTYYFIDGLIKLSGKLKKDVLIAADVYGSSYRSDRKKFKVSNNNRLLLLKYFDYNNVNIKDKDKYEVCLTKAYYTYYYCEFEKAKETLCELNTFIEENNQLKPIFILFKILLKILLINNLEKLRLEVKANLEFINAFKNHYYKGIFLNLFLIIKFYISPSKQLSEEIEKNLYINKEFNWLYNMLKGSLFYIDEKYDLAIIHYNNALSYLLMDKYNLSRSIRLVINICACYNDLELYSKSLQYSSRFVEFMCFKNAEFTKEMLMHYLYSIYMLGLEQRIISFIKVTPVYQNLNVITAIILLIVATKLNDGDTINKLGKLSKSIVEDKNYTNMIKYLESNDDTYLIDLINVPYMKGIKSKLTRKKVSK